MANKKMEKVQKIVESFAKLLPPGLVPDSYIEYLVLDNMDCCDTRDELMGNVKMQLAEETGVDLLMTRKEAEEYLYYEIDDVQWNTLSHDEMISARQVKVIEDYEDKTVLEMIKEMPLIPASRVISSMIINYLTAHGQEVTPEGEMDITEDIIHMLGSSFNDALSDEDDDEDDYDEDDFELEWEDGFDPDWLEDDEDEDDDPSDAGTKSENSSDVGPKPGNPGNRKGRRSRITKFPGNK